MALTLEISVTVYYDKEVPDPEGAAGALYRNLDNAIQNGLFNLPRFDPIEVGQYEASVVCIGNQPEDDED